jgi:Citrate transporter
MTLDQALSFAVIIGMMALFAWGRLRYDLVALLALLAALAARAFSGFSDDIVIIVGSALVVSAAVARSGVIERVVRKVGSHLVTATVTPPRSWFQWTPPPPDGREEVAGRADGLKRIGAVAELGGKASLGEVQAWRRGRAARRPHHLATRW